MESRQSYILALRWSSLLFAVDAVDRCDAILDPECHKTANLMHRTNHVSSGVLKCEVRRSHACCNAPCRSSSSLITGYYASLNGELAGNRDLNRGRNKEHSDELHIKSAGCVSYQLPAS